MVVTFNHELPTVEELTVEEVPISTPGLRAAAHHLGKAFRFKLFSSSKRYCIVRVQESTVWTLTMTLWCANKRRMIHVNAWTKARRSLVVRFSSSGRSKAVATTSFRYTATASISPVAVWSLNLAARPKPCMTSVCLKKWALSDPNLVSFAKRVSTRAAAQSLCPKVGKNLAIYRLVSKTTRTKNDHQQNMDNVTGTSSNLTVC